MWQISFSIPLSADVACINTLDEVFETTTAFENKESQTWDVQIIFEHEPASTVPDQISQILLIFDLTAEINLEKLPEKDWLSENRKDFPALSIGSFFIHGSHIEAPQDSDLIPLKIDAALAFGTGEHATTRGCLEVLEGLPEQSSDATCLDLGCGTAILAMAMAKLWGTQVMASDIDPLAVQMAEGNCLNNGVAQHITCLESAGFAHPLIDAAAPYDVIAANILAKPLCELADELVARVAPGGHIVLSGLLVDQAPEVLAAYLRDHVELVEQKNINEWATLHLRVS